MIFVMMVVHAVMVKLFYINIIIIFQERYNSMPNKGHQKNEKEKLNIFTRCDKVVPGLGLQISFSSSYPFQKFNLLTPNFQNHTQFSKPCLI
jgi:hypothetical protein